MSIEAIKGKLKELEGLIGNTLYLKLSLSTRGRSGEYLERQNIITTPVASRIGWPSIS